MQYIYLEDDMLCRLFFCATFTGRRGCHTPFVQAGAETSNTGAKKIKVGPMLFLAGPFQKGGCWCRGWKDGVSWGCPTTPHSIGDPPTAPHVCCCCQMNWWVVRRVTNGCVDLRRHAFALGGQVSVEWSRCPGSMPRRARDSVAPLRRSSAGWMSARIGRLSAGLGHRHPVTIGKASLMAGSMRQVWALRHQTGAQYSAVEWTRDRVAVRRVAVPAPHRSQQAASGVRRVMSASSEVTQGVGDTWATCPTLLRGIWVRSRRAGFRFCGWHLAHI